MSRFLENSLLFAFMEEEKNGNFRTPCTIYERIDPGGKTSVS